MLGLSQLTNTTDNYKMKCDRFQDKQGQVEARSPKGEGASASMNLLSSMKMPRSGLLSSVQLKSGPGETQG